MSERSPRIIAIIPARGGSKGIPKKNIVEVCGKPLIYYTIREAQKAKHIDATIISTDSEEIAEVAKKYGGDVPFLRPSHLSGDSVRDVEYLKHALDWTKEHRGWDPEYIVLLPPTTPSRLASDIDLAVECILKENADSVRTMTMHPHFNKPQKMWFKTEDNKVKPLFPEGKLGLPRQEIKVCYMPVAAAYVTKASLIKEGRLWGEDVRMVDFPLDRFTDIDDREDLHEAERVLLKFNLN